jgi:hypothetical protein
MLEDGQDLRPWFWQDVRRDPDTHTEQVDEGIAHSHHCADRQYEYDGDHGEKDKASFEFPLSLRLETIRPAIPELGKVLFHLYLPPLIL